MAKVFKLPNGIRGVVDERSGSGKVIVNVAIKKGSAHEDSEENGLTNLMQEARYGGTKNYNRDELAEVVESRGGSIDAGTGRETSGFDLVAFKADIEEQFAVMADLMINPTFDPKEIKKTKKQVLQGISQRDEDSSDKASRIFFENSFGEQGLGAAIEGTEDLVKSFSVEQIKAKHKELLSNPENTVFSFSGDITEQKAQELIEKHFSGLKQNVVEKKHSVNFVGDDYREDTDNNQLNIIFGFKAPARKEAGVYASILLEEALCGGMSSPLFQEVREKRGLVYNVGAEYTPFDSAGIFAIDAGTGKGNVKELMEVSFDLLGDIIKNGFSEEELKTARERLVRNFSSAHEISSATAEINAKSILRHNKIHSLESYKARLESVTSDDIRRVVIDMFQTDNCTLAAIGPQETMPSKQEIKGMMQQKLEGVVIPPPVVKKEFAVKENFNAVSKDMVFEKEPCMTILDNGMKVVTVERPGFLSCGAWIGIGSDNETSDINGAAHALEHMVFRGTESYKQGEVDRIVEQELAADFNAGTGHDMTTYYFYNTPIEAIDKVVDICGEMVFKPNINHAEFNGKGDIKGERDIVIEELKLYDDDIEQNVGNILCNTIYPNQSQGRAIVGTEKTLSEMTVEKLKKYHNEYYVPNNVIFSATGPIKHDDFVALIDKKFGGMPAKKYSEQSIPKYHGGIGYKEMEDAVMCNSVIVAEGASSSDIDKCISYELFCDILGGGESSPLYEKIINQNEFSDEVFADHSDYKNYGMFVAGADVDACNLKSFISNLYEEINNLANDLSESNLEKAKLNFKMSMLGLETNIGICEYYGEKALISGDKIISTGEIIKKVEALTVDDMKRVAREILASEPALAMVAPVGTDRSLIPQTKKELEEIRDNAISSTNKVENKNLVVPK